MTALSRIALVPLIALALAGCTVTGGKGFVAGDLQMAATIANSPNVPAQPAAANAVDPTGYACWGSLEPAVAAIDAGGTVGLATMIEIARVAIIEVRQGGPCGTLAAPMLGQLALLPGAGNAIALAATSVR